MRKLANLLPISFGVTGQEPKGMPHMYGHLFFRIDLLHRNRKTTFGLRF
jgi:hypothetical protein